MGRKQIPIKIALRPSTTAATWTPKIQNKPADRDRHEDGLLPAERGQIVKGQRGQGERHEHLERAALKRSFLDPVDLEDRQEECQVNEVAQERPQAAPARFGLTVDRVPLPARARALGLFSATGRYCWCSARLGLDATELRVSAPMGPPPLPAHPIHGRRA